MSVNKIDLRKNAALLAGAAAMAFGLSGCATAELEPAPQANAAPSVAPSAARATEAGVMVTALPQDTWTGPFRITEEVTPMKVRIQNNGTRPLLVGYDRFALIGMAGKRYRAIPLYQMDASVPAALSVVDPTPMTDLGFTYSGFEVAPFYSSVYPGITPYAGSYPIAAPYYGLYGTTYVNTQLPTAEMRRRALPEGVLAPGGYVEGYLYFEKVPASEDRVSFNYNFVNPLTNAIFADVNIPFDVE